MDFTSAPLGHLEKPMQFRWCAVFISAALFFECYLAIRFQISLRILSWDWFKSNIDLAESILIVFAYSFTFAVLIPGVGFTGRLLFSGIIFNITYWIERRILSILKVKARDNTLDKYKELGRFYTIWGLKKKALKDKNTPMYQEVVKRESDVQELSFLRYVCQSILALSAIDRIVSIQANPTVIRSFEAWANSLPFYWQGLADLVVSVFVLFIFGIAFEKRDFDRYILIERDEFEDANALKAPPKPLHDRRT